MTFPNHVAAGVTFTAIFSAITDINIFSDPKLLILTVCAAVLPDIDHTAGPVGKTFYPLARWLHRRYGHRTLTHSAVALLTLTFLVGVLETWFGTDNSYRIVFFFAYFSHIIGDMITIQGVQFFYPFSKAPCVIPGKRELRFRTGDRAHETLLFAGIALVFLFCQPLIQDGFWTTYNRSFGYPKHLWSEFKKSEDVLSVDFSFRDGSEIYEGTGLCLEAEENKFTLLENGKFRLLDGSKQVILSTVPTHTGRRFSFPRLTFVGISPDSLNELCSDKNIMHLEVTADRKFDIALGNIRQTASRYSGDYLNDPIIFGSPQQITGDSAVIPVALRNPHIESLTEKLHDLTNRRSNYEHNLTAAERSLKILRDEARQTEDLYVRETLMQRVNDTEKEIEKYRSQISTGETKIVEVRRQIRELKAKDRQNYGKQLRQAQLKNQSTGETTEPGLTGILEYVIIEESAAEEQK